MIIHIYTCECGEQFRSRNKAYAFELLCEHRTESKPKGAMFPTHDMQTVNAEHSTVETPDVVIAEPKWRPADA